MVASSLINHHQLAELASLLAEPARAAMVLALVDGTSRPSGELARAAGVGAATASAHLKRLLDGGMLAVHVQGRHRYYRLADDDIASLVEAMALPRRGVPALSRPADTELRRARTCYRHLAGQLGVAFCDAMLARGHLRTVSEGLQLTEQGLQALEEAGLDASLGKGLADLRGRSCIDWTERRLHVGGPLGVAMTRAMLDACWLRPASSGRALVPTVDGLRRLGRLGVSLS